MRVPFTAMRPVDNTPKDMWARLRLGIFALSLLRVSQRSRTLRVVYMCVFGFIPICFRPCCVKAAFACHWSTSGAWVLEEACGFRPRMFVSCGKRQALWPDFCHTITSVSWNMWALQISVPGVADKRISLTYLSAIENSLWICAKAIKNRSINLSFSWASAES